MRLVPGQTHKSNRAERKFGLRKRESIHSLQRFSDKLSEKFGVPPAEVSEDNNLTKIKRVGWFSVPNTIKVCKNGRCKATVAHEFAHYLDALKRGQPGAHDRRFKAIHRIVLRQSLNL